MRISKITTFGVILILLLAVFSASLPPKISHAQDDSPSDWSIWLYDQRGTALTRIGLDGTVLDNIQLPLLADHKALQSTFAFSPDGNLLATCSSNADETLITLVIYDTLQDEILHTRELGDVLYCTLLKGSFSEDGRFLAYGAIYDFYNGQPPEPWLFEIMDIATGEIIATLAPAEPALDIIQYSSLPGSVFFDASAQYIVISMEGYAIDGGFPTSTFIWRYAEGQFTPQTDNLYGKRGLNILPQRGEIIWLDRNDQDYTPSEIIGSAPNLNIVMSSDKTGQHKVIAALGPGQGMSLRYVQNGQSILIWEIGTEGEIEDMYTKWWQLDRSGQRTLIPALTVRGGIVVGTETGFMVLQPIDTGVTFVHYEFVGNTLNEGEMVWQTATEITTTWFIAWSTPLAGQADYPTWTAQ